MFQFNHCISQHFWFIFFYHTETQVWYTPSLRKGKWYFGSPVPPTVSTHPSTQQGFWSAPVPNRSQNTLAWGQEGLEILSASPSPPAAHENTLPRAAGTSAPATDTSRHFLSPFVVALKVADLQSLPKFSSSSLLWLRQLLFVPAYLSAMPVHLHKASQAHMNCSYCYFALFSFTPNQGTAPHILCSIYSYAAQNQADASTQDMPENTIFLLCFDSLAFISIFLWGWYVNNRE